MQTRHAVLAIQSILGTFWQGLGDTIKAGRSEAAALAVEQSFSWNRYYWDKTGRREELRKKLTAEAERNVEAAVARIYKTHIPLAESVYKTRALADGWVDKKVTSGLARGLTVDEMKKEVTDFIKPDVKGGVSYAARRLARSEINNAYHATTIVHNEELPFVESMTWRLSGSHPRLDICNVLEQNSPYPKEKVPPKAHPQCLCTVYPNTTSHDDFFKAFNEGQYDTWLDSLPD